MKNSCINLLFILVFPLIICAQNNNVIFSDAMNEFHNNNFAKANLLFEQLENNENIDDRLISSAKYYSAECLIALGQVDGAISKLENFLDVYLNSNYRELGLYRLGSLYFDLKLFENSRLKLVELVNEFPLSEYSGSAYHLIGESFIEENRIDDAEEFFNSAVLSKKK